MLNQYELYGFLNVNVITCAIFYRFPVSVKNTFVKSKL